MKENDKRLAQWAVEKVKKEFSQDICLLLEHRTLRLPPDQEYSAFSFYIPAAARSNALARTFIIGGIGYDLFPMSWERIERTAELREYNTTCLADAEILYARNEADKRRFTSLQARLAANLENPQYTHDRAAEWYKTATEIYQHTLFEEQSGKIRENSGYICDLLSIATALINHTYFAHGQTSQITELEKMEKLPLDFTGLYRAIVLSKFPEEQKKLCHRMLQNAKTFLDENDPSKAAATGKSKPDFSELAAWYQELSYTWQRVYYWCDAKDPVNAYIWACMLQDEAARMGSQYGITGTDMLGDFDAGNLPAFKQRAEAVEKQFTNAIAKSGVTLETYKDIEGFLQKNEI
jgi:hypothetical protein